MAGAALMVRWGNPVRGREQLALQVFSEALQLYGRMQQQGEIESFEPFALDPYGANDPAGFFIIRGDRTKLERLRYSEEFQRLNARVLHVVESFGVIGASYGEELQKLFNDWGTQAAELLQQPVGATA